MGEIVGIRKVPLAAVLSAPNPDTGEESELKVVKQRQPKPCETCGEFQEPIHIEALEMYIDRPPVCETCRQKAEAEEKARAAQQRKDNIERDLALCGVPPQFLTYSFTHGANGPINWGKAKSAAESCLGFSLRPEGGLILSGKTGRGKSHLAVAILREVVLRGGRGRFVNCLDFMSALRNVYKARDDEDDASEQDVINRVGRGVVILDDLGSARVTPLMRDAMTLIVDRCERRGQPLVVTTNLPVAEIGEQIDERLASRLVGLCRSNERIMTIEGPDHRIKFKKS
jgi:DNA replication protein DnaC